MENEILVKNETEYTYERYLKLNKFNMYKAKKVTAIVLILSIIVIFVCGIIMMIFGNYDDAVIYILLSILFTLFTIFVPNIQTKKIFKSDSLLNQKVKNTIEFYDDRIEISNEKSNTKLEYKDIYKIYETKDSFYIYLNKIQVVIVAKDCFEIGDTEKLRNLFIEKVDKNYIKKF